MTETSDEDHALAQRMSDRAFESWNGGESAEALVDLDRLTERFDGSEDPVIEGYVAGALGLKAFVIGESERIDESLDVYRGLFKRFGDSSSPDTQGHLARALQTMGGLLASVGREVEALGAYDRLMIVSATASTKTSK